MKYLVAGAINTLAGYGVFLALFQWADFTPELANAIGYITALLVAFSLNHVLVFARSNLSVTTVLRFISAFLVAFLINQAILVMLYRTLLMRPEIAQIFAMITYTVIFYLLNKYFVFVSKTKTLSNR